MYIYSAASSLPSALRAFVPYIAATWGAGESMKGIAGVGYKEDGRLMRSGHPARPPTPYLAESHQPARDRGMLDFFLPEFSAQPDLLVPRLEIAVFGGITHNGASCLVKVRKDISC